ncbi:MAG: tRNA uridine-5-carboxymethylaminomethyl(34) synthesis GTPase MnmE [Chloroflexi bacterium]|nr:tRNA uridine-5-carboxymethylaminomethyl(34) synthesis GTPase MnmE [Chloroflexota bacterium]
MLQDTIAAISTPLGYGGIGLVRLSGPQARAIAQRLFSGRLAPRRLAYGYLHDPTTGEAVDEVLAAYMKAPHTYTREDMVEINGHGGPVALARILELALAEGARLAQPGEFTLRAFLNGRLDLAQAEAVLDIVQARTAASLRLSVEGLRGDLSAALKELRGGLMEALAYLTARVDFPEDDIPAQDLAPALAQAQARLERLREGARTGLIYRQGVKTAIVGRPNVGKSSLLNRLLRTPRAIVSPQPGTTRDTIEETTDLRGIPFVLTDTAGLGESRDALDALGMERSRRAMAAADFVLLVLDGSEPLTPADEQLMAELQGKAALAAVNKSDLPRRADLSRLPWPAVSVSALTGEGLEELEGRLAAPVLGGQVVCADGATVASARHHAALSQAAQRLAAARTALETDLPEDFIALDLAATLDALGEITGEKASEGLLEAIFSRFCVGK